ncbi:MAG: hypothetical protein ACOX6O_12215 [Christensenellales bacterium]|jgi:hypothetical protein
MNLLELKDDAVTGQKSALLAPVDSVICKKKELEDSGVNHCAKEADKPRGSSSCFACPKV